MSALNETAEMVKGLSTGGDPVLEATKWVVLIVMLIGAMAVPFMMLLNKKTKDENENALESSISKVGSTLYDQLGKQVEEYRLAADAANRERNELILKSARLEAQLIALEPVNELVERLRAKLDVKDGEIKGLLEQGLLERTQFMNMVTAKDGDISKRDDRIYQLEKVTTALQVRLARDDAFTALTTDAVNPKKPAEAAALVDSIIPANGRRITDDNLESPI